MYDKTIQKTRRLLLDTLRSPPIADWRNACRLPNDWRNSRWATAEYSDVWATSVHGGRVVGGGQHKAYSRPYAIVAFQIPHTPNTHHRSQYTTTNKSFRVREKNTYQVDYYFYSRTHGVCWPSVARAVHGCFMARITALAVRMVATAGMTSSPFGLTSKAKTPRMTRDSFHFRGACSKNGKRAERAY